MLKKALARFMGADQEEQRFHATFNRVIAQGRYLDGREGLLLDIGARDGAHTRTFLDALAARQATAAKTGRAATSGWEPVIVELNPDYLAVAQTHFRCVAANAERALPFGDRAAACIVVNQILEHLKDPFHLLAECDRVLNVGGALIIGVPNLAGLLNRLYLLIGRQPPAIHMPGPHVRGYALSALRAYLTSNANFRMRRFFGSCLYPLPPCLSEPAAVIFPGLASYTFFVLEKVRDAQPSAWLMGADSGETHYA
jgi:SAM-dependent methyltransferase